jgi:hypothetical protein
MAKEPKELVNQEELGIDGTWNHNYIKDVRRRMTAGEKLPECIECHHLERNGIMSSRQWENTVWADVIDDVVAKASVNDWEVEQPLQFDFSMPSGWTDGYRRDPAGMYNGQNTYAAYMQKMMG